MKQTRIIFQVIMLFDTQEYVQLLINPVSGLIEGGAEELIDLGEILNVGNAVISNCYIRHRQLHKVSDTAAESALKKKGVFGFLRLSGTSASLYVICRRLWSGRYWHRRL